MLMERIPKKEEIDDVVERKDIRANGRMAFDRGGILCNWRTRRGREGHHHSYWFGCRRMGSSHLTASIFLMTYEARSLVKIDRGCLRRKVKI